MVVNKFNLSKKSMALIAAVILLVVMTFVSCLGNDSKDKKSNSQSSIFAPSTSQTKNSSTLPIDDDSQTTVPKVEPEPFSSADKKNFYALATTGTVDPYNPEMYTSPRYEAILGGDSSSGVPRSELDNPINSDLDATTFKASRDSAIEITRAQITGEGASKYPTFFNEENQPGTCTKFVLENAGAISLPIPNDNRWIIAIVFWKATCGVPNSGTYKVEQQTSVYFTVDNGSLTPRKFGEIPNL